MNFISKRKMRERKDERIHTKMLLVLTMNNKEIQSMDSHDRINVVQISHLFFSP